MFQRVLAGLVLTGVLVLSGCCHTNHCARPTIVGSSPACCPPSNCCPPPNCCNKSNGGAVFVP